MHMGSRIRARLAELGWKQRDLLERVPGLEVGTLSAIIARDSRRSDWSEQIATALRVRHAWLTRGEQPKEIPHAGGDAPAPAPIGTWATLDDLADDEVAMVERRALSLRPRLGGVALESEHLPPLPLPAALLRARYVTRHDRLAIVYAEGGSMHPTISHGDTVVCDVGQTDVIDGGVYAIDYGGNLRVQRLRKRVGGGLTIISDNPQHPPEVLAAEETRHVTILGRVLWRGGFL